MRAHVFQSTHPVRGATDVLVEVEYALVISIHAPREGCDYRQPAPTTEGVISIHAPREGCDRMTSGGCATRSYFNPRTP